MAEILTAKGHMHYADSVLAELNEKMKGRKPLFPITFSSVSQYNEFVATVIVE